MSFTSPYLQALQAEFIRADLESSAAPEPANIPPPSNRILFRPQQQPANITSPRNDALSSSTLDSASQDQQPDDSCPPSKLRFFVALTISKLTFFHTLGHGTKASVRNLQLFMTFALLHNPSARMANRDVSSRLYLHAAMIRSPTSQTFPHPIFPCVIPEPRGTKSRMATRLTPLRLFRVHSLCKRVMSWAVHQDKHLVRGLEVAHERIISRQKRTNKATCIAMLQLQWLVSRLHKANRVNPLECHSVT